MTSIGKGICGWVTSLTASVALALVLLLGGAQPASSAPGQCPTLTSNEIDDEFTNWSAVVAFDPLTDFITCRDDPTIPEIRFTVTSRTPPQFFQIKLIRFEPILLEGFTIEDRKSVV